MNMKKIKKNKKLSSFILMVREKARNSVSNSYNRVKRTESGNGLKNNSGTENRSAPNSRVCPSGNSYCTGGSDVALKFYIETIQKKEKTKKFNFFFIY